MNRLSTSCLLSVLLLGATHQALAQELFIYPDKGQSSDQQAKDKLDCSNWAKTNTGYDPANPATGSVALSEPEQQAGGAVHGAAGGAAFGAIAGDSSEAARRGAVAGAVVGGLRQRRANREAEAEHQQEEQQLVAQSTAKKDDFNRAYAACLEGRGYTVK
ncbi:glycine zipper family protein [Marinobacter sp.]|uniref:glycine zipper family protein n=1 Tax=Marinobacter sp. TaxID=50741 RepID=UPI003A8C9A9A